MSFRRAVLFLFAAATGLFGQSESGRAALDGRVTDASNKVISGAEIAIRQAQTGFERKVTTNADGEFRALALPVGIYTIEAVSAGFGASRAENVALTVGETKSVNFTLEVATVSTQITVVEQAQVVNVTDVSTATSLNERAIEDLPMRGRNFAQFLQLTPNSVQEQNRFGIVVNGQRSINSNISIDGVDFNDPLQGGQRGGGANQSAYFFPQVAVREFQVVRDGASAEVGRTNSGYVNVVTKSGTNLYHGEGFYNNRNGSLTSPAADGSDSSANAQNQFGGAVGGPIKRDRLFFFGALEKNLVTIPFTVKFNTPTGNFPIPADIAAQQGTFTGKNNPLVAFGRLDYQLSAKNSLNLQYTYAAQYGLSFNVSSGLTNISATNNSLLDRESQGVKAGWTSVITPSLLNEVRGQYAYDNRFQPPASTLPEVDFSDNWAQLGGAKVGIEIYNATRYEILDNLSWTHGIHIMKFGVDFNISPEQQQREANFAGLYTFKNLSDYVAALAGDKTKINRYQQSIAANGTQGMFEGTQQDRAVFFTDSMRVRRDLTITAGLRWEGQLNPQPTTPNPKYAITSRIPNDLKMWQPRLGIAWNVGGRGTTVVRLSGGLFDSRTPAYLMQKVFTDNGLNTLALDTRVDPTLVNFITVPNRIDTLPNVKLPLTGFIFGFAPEYRNPRSGQVAFSIEQQLDKDTKITAGFVRNSTWALQRRIDTNLFAPSVLPNGMPVYPTFGSNGALVYASGWDNVTGPIFIDPVTRKTLTPAIARPDPGVQQININESVGHSSYNGFSFSIQRRMSRRLQFGINYTHAFNRDDDSNERDFNRQTALNTYNLKLDGGWSKNDVRNSENLNILYDLGRGFTVSTLFFARTGIPVKAVTSLDLQNDGNSVNDVPILNGRVVPRNSIRQPGFLDWDIRLLKEFKIGERMRVDFSIEGFNLTRATNKYFTSDGESVFGAPQATVNPRTGLPYQSNTALIPTNFPGTDYFGGARQAQLGVRVVF